MRVSFSTNVSWPVRDQLSIALGFKCIDDLGKYLRVKLNHDRVFRGLIGKVVENMKHRLNLWKAKILSFAVCLTLTKLIMFSISSYVMQSVHLPRSVCDEGDQVYRNFLWGDLENGRQIHLVAWDRVCQPEEAGGLGIFMLCERLNASGNISYFLLVRWSSLQGSSNPG